MGTTEISESRLPYIPQFPDEDDSPSLPYPSPDPENPPAGPETDTSPFDRATQRPGRDATRTAISDLAGDKPLATVKEVGELVGAIVAALAVGLALALKWQTGNRSKLRQPTKAQASAIGQPLGEIAYRHIPTSKLVPDLRDAVLAAVALNSYLDDGPLISPNTPDAGVPADINQETS